jgi:hypothetical protein
LALLQLLQVLLQLLQVLLQLLQVLLQLLQRAKGARLHPEIPAAKQTPRQLQASIASWQAPPTHTPRSPSHAGGPQLAGTSSLCLPAPTALAWPAPAA